MPPLSFLFAETFQLIVENSLETSVIFPF